MYLQFLKEVYLASVIEKRFPIATKELKVFLKSFLTPAVNFLIDWIVCDFLENHNFFQTSNERVVNNPIKTKSSSAVSFEITSSIGCF